MFVQDSIDDRFRTPDELSKRVGHPIIGLVRALPELKGAGIKKVSAHHEPSSAFVESFRTLRTSLALSASESTRIAFTSSEPGDGKTTVIANLAVVYAQSGKRTLVIDADLRRPGLTRLFDFKSKSGMSDILAADIPVQEIISNHIVPTEARNLDVLPAGPRRQNPSELLASDRLAQILAWAEGEYDQILVDCPPTLVASDAVLVGRITDGMVMVVRPEKNRRKIVFRAAQNLLEMKIPVYGLVANCIDTENSKGYNFGDGEGYSYGYGEEEINEVNEVTSTPLNFEDCYAGIRFQSKSNDSTINEIEATTQNRRVA